MSREARWSLCLWMLAVPAALCEEIPPGALLRRTTSLRLEVAGGRIASPTLGRAANRSFSDEKGQVKESLLVNPSGDEPSLAYRYKSPQRQWSFDLQGTTSVVLRDSTPQETLIFQQRAGEPLKLTIEAAAAPKREFTSRSLWHWLVFSPEIREALIPRLELLRSEWELNRQTDEIRTELIEADHRALLQRRWQWQQCVAQLGDDDYQVRQAADRMLRSGGAAAAAFLQTLNEAQLGPEQRRRIGQIVTAAVPDVDEPAGVASAWCFDAEIWCMLLKDDADDVRALAGEHLTHLLGRPLVFEPSAQTTTRTAQVRVIEETLLRR